MEKSRKKESFQRFAGLTFNLRALYDRSDDRSQVYMSILAGPLAHQTVRGRFAEAIRRAILDGSLSQGERLVERKLASHFQISLSAVREALVELEAQGFVTKKPNAATYVTRFNNKDVAKIFDFRKLVETYAIEEAARQAEPEDVVLLERLYLDLLDAARSSDVALFVQKDLALHEAVWQMSRNEYVTSALERAVRPFFSIYRSYSRSNLEIRKRRESSS
jgi:DNA-binding GntR family transcriptional regulator